MLPLDDDVDALRDREATRRRCQKLARELKRQMGPRAYEGFRGRALAYQTDEITALAFSDFLLEALGRARGTRELAREVVRTLPCERLRSGLRRALGDALDVEGEGPGPGPGSTATTKERGMKIETIAPGLVCLRKFLSVKQQECLTRTSFEPTCCAAGAASSTGARAPPRAPRHPAPPPHRRVHTPPRRPPRPAAVAGSTPSVPEPTDEVPRARG